MKRRNWALLVLCIAGLSSFLLSRTVWGPPSKAAASEHVSEAVDQNREGERRYIQNEPRHWRYVMLKQ